MKLYVYICALYFVIFSAVGYSELPAFPGAEGFGSFTPGGRGGRIIFVDNLNDSGAGSLRDALEESGSRIIIFRVSGYIDLETSIVVRNPFFTLAAQTAPGDGIATRKSHIRIETHDFIIRGLRARTGDSIDGAPAGNRDGIDIWNGRAYNGIIDHSSFSWGVDENVSLGSGAHDITISWCIIAEALNNSIHPEGPHSKGLMFHRTAGSNLSAHHNIIISNSQRNPQIKAIHNEIINNVVYNYGNKAANVWLKSGSTANIINNMFIAGPSTRIIDGSYRKGIYIQHDIFPGTPNDTGTVSYSVYLKGNIGPGREEITSYSIEEELRAVDNTENPLVEFWTTDPFPLSNVTIDSTDSLINILFSDTGAGAITPDRDEIDKRILQTFYDDDGKIINSQDEVGGWIPLNSLTVPLDNDNDGISDSWELQHGLDPNDSSDALSDRNGDGYMNIEEYINGLIGDNRNISIFSPANLNLSR